MLPDIIAEILNAITDGRIEDLPTLTGIFVVALAYVSSKRDGVGSVSGALSGVGINIGFIETSPARTKKAPRELGRELALDLVKLAVMGLDRKAALVGLSMCLMAHAGDIGEAANAVLANPADVFEGAAEAL